MPLSIEHLCQHRVAAAAAGITFLTGALGLAGWILDIDDLKGISSTGINMKANTALALMLLPTALLLLVPDTTTTVRSFLGRGLAGSAGLIGLLTLLEHVTSLDFGIDQLLFTEAPGAAATVSPGRMGPPASLSFTIAAIGLLLLPVRRGTWTQGAGVLIATIASIPILGYAYDIDPLYGISRYTGIALPTAIGLLALGVALIVVRPNAGFMPAFCSEDAGGVMARRLFLPALFLPFTVAWLRTLGERAGWIDPALGRPLIVVFLTIVLVALIADNARTINRLEKQRLDAEREKAADLEAARLAAEQARAVAEKASRAKSDFLAALSHELRTPLSPVMLALSGLERHPKFPPELREDLQLVRQNLRLETKLISDLLDVTRIENQKLALELIEVDLHEVLRETARLCANDESAPVVLDLCADAPWVNGDDMRIRQVFWNLVSNAQKFTPRDGRITLRTERPDENRVRILVRDSGTGIVPEMLRRLFLPFEQGAATRPRGGAGLGLGLSIARRLVEAHHGSITATSDGEGRGATFVVELPALAKAPVIPAAREATALVTRTALRILLVEDHPATQFVLKKLLSGLGHTVTTAGTVAEAVGLAQTGSYDALLSDLGLPDGSGLDVLRAVSHIYRGRAVALSGYGTEADVAASREAGFSAHLVKPVELAAIVAALNSLAVGGPGRDVTDPATDAAEMASV